MASARSTPNSCPRIWAAPRAIVRSGRRWRPYRVRYVGDRVAVIIAASEDLARDAAELVSVDYEELPAVVRAEDAMKPGAPLVHDSVPPATSRLRSRWATPRRSIRLSRGRRT